METVYLDYSKKGVAFYYIYKSLAHPELEGYVTPFSVRERLMHVQEAKATLGTRIPWICDPMANPLKHALGNSSNAEFVIDPEGRVLVRRQWSNPEQLRLDLEKLVGKVEPATQVSDLDLKKIKVPKGVATGVLPRVQTQGPMRALKIEPLSPESDTPYYVKLRAEADRALLNTGAGKLYVGFHLDPLYKVHWNNLVEPLSYELKTPEGVKIAPSTGKAPKVEEAADADPREFLLDVEARQLEEPIELTARYFACDDANTFCIPVTQSYRLHLKADPDGGSAMERRARGGPGPGTFPRGSMVERMLARDTDGDGRLSREEVPQRLQRRFENVDSDGDGYLDRAELEAMQQRMRRRRPQ